KKKQRAFLENSREKEEKISGEKSREFWVLFLQPGCVVVDVWKKKVIL
ncbi:unnamed protein product, partial [Brassica rapa subsp. narinosa]